MKKKCCNNCQHHTEVYYANPEIRYVEKWNECDLHETKVAPSSICNGYMGMQPPFCYMAPTKRVVNIGLMAEVDNSPTLY